MYSSLVTLNSMIPVSVMASENYESTESCYFVFHASKNITSMTLCFKLLVRFCSSITNSNKLIKRSMTSDTLSQTDMYKTRFIKHEFKFISFINSALCVCLLGIALVIDIF